MLPVAFVSALPRLPFIAANLTPSATSPKSPRQFSRLLSSSFVSRRYRPTPLNPIQHPHCPHDRQSNCTRHIIHCQQRSRGGGGGGGGVAISERVLSILPYLIPLLDSLSFGKYVFSKVPLVGQLLLPPLLPLYSIYRGVPFLAFGVFLLLYVLVVRNTSVSRYVRFNTYQALIIDIALIIPQLFQGVSLPIPSAIAETCTTAVFYAAMLAVIYSVVRNAQGLVPDEIPGISDSVYQQLGPF